MVAPANFADQKRTGCGGPIPAYLPGHNSLETAHRTGRYEGRFVCSQSSKIFKPFCKILFSGLSKFAKLARSVTRSRSVLVSQFSSHLPNLKDTTKQSHLAQVSKPAYIYTKNGVAPLNFFLILLFHAAFGFLRFLFSF